MKLNLDCVRDVLLYLENTLNLHNAVLASAICFDNYESADIVYSILKLDEAGYLNVKDASTFTSKDCYIYSITWDGHQFLDTVRPETVWNKTKNVASKVGTMTIKGIFQIGSQVISQLIANSLSPQ